MGGFEPSTPAIPAPVRPCPISAVFPAFSSNCDQSPSSGVQAYPAVKVELRWSKLSSPDPARPPCPAGFVALRLPAHTWTRGVSGTNLPRPRDLLLPLMLPRSPSAPVPKLRPEESPIMPFTPEEVRKFRTPAAGNRKQNATSLCLWRISFRADGGI
jgi:hypothetical protein